MRPGLLAAALLLILSVAAPRLSSKPAPAQSVLGQAFIAARLWVRLVFWASETALFQGRLAHAGSVAAAAPVWPESASAEAIGRQ